jgi:murein L,D-transpeptidase YcbB/YkuD
MNRLIVRCSLAVVVAIGAVSCGSGRASEETVQGLKDRLQAAAPPEYAPRGKQGTRVLQAARAFYERRSHQPAWFEGGRPTGKVDELRSAIEAIRSDGLDPADYDLGPALAAPAQKSGGLFKRGGFSAEQVADADLRVTVTFLTLASHLLTGRVDPGQVDPHWFGQTRQVDLAGVLDRALGQTGAGPALQELVPQHRQYALLKEALRKERAAPSPDAARIRAIELNLERWRWLPESFGERHIVVNVPTFTLNAVDGDRALTMRVVAGEKENPTPIFSDQMTTVVFSPYWNIPATIARKETIPAVLRDPDYLYENDLEVVRGTRVLDPRTVDWTDDDPDFRIRQRPGSRNSLGHVKFMFPNKFDVYLHDTPADSLFRRVQRDFSHGCVRVEKPEELAAWVLSGQEGWTPEKIHAAMYSGREQHVAVKRKVPVFIVYQTVWVDGDGKVHFAGDVYGHDARQIALLDPRGRPAPARRVASN